jgi:septum formation protein
VTPLLILASASPRRRKILEDLGLPFRVVVADVDETPRPGEAPTDLVLRLAREKAMRVAEKETLPVLAADTVVVLEGEVLGKPASEEMAVEMLRRLGGRTHEVLTGVCLVAADGVRTALERSEVTFGSLSEGEIARYVQTGEPFDKAGAYHVEGKGAFFIAAVRGSPSNVAGLPARAVYVLAREAKLLGED